MQITVTCELTARNLEILKQLCEGKPCENLSEPFEKPAEEHPVENSFPEPQGYAIPQIATPKTEEKPKLTAADVKAVCLKFSKAGRQSELKAAFAKFGAKKLTEISEDDYPALMEELGNE